MRFLLFIVAVIFFSVEVVAQKANVACVTLPQLFSVVSRPSDTLYVVNFWATWCKPCVAELPYFEQLRAAHANKKLKILLVSLDSPKQISRVEAMKKEKNLQNSVVLLNEKNPNRWINEVDSTWSGAIPATAFYRNQNKILFHEGEFTFHQLDSITQNHIP